MGLGAFDNTAIQQAISVPQPAAGADWVFTVPAGQQYKIECMFFTLATSAVVANRTVRVQITDGTNIIWEGGDATVSYTASASYHFGLGRLSVTALGSSQNVGQTMYLPDVWLPPGYTLQTSTVNKDVGDQFSIVRGIARITSSS